ncbi:MAG: tetratricopeptide repeat protein [Cyanobacteria bacterium J06639_16]
MTFPIDDVLNQYGAALITLEQSDDPTPEEALTVLVNRDRVQQALQQTSVSSAMLLVILQYDQRLKSRVEQALQIFDFASWRALVNPQPQAWWWFLDEANRPQQLDPMSVYEHLITQLDNYPSRLADSSLQQSADAEATVAAAAIAAPTTEHHIGLTRQILEVYRVRDGLQQQVESGELSAEQLAKLGQLDDHFRHQLDDLSQQADRRHLSKMLDQLDKVRRVFNPPVDAWWWFSKVNVHWWDSLDWVWNALTLVFLTASFSLLTDTVTRFLTGGPGVVGGFAVITQASLALIGGGSLTKTGKQLVARALETLQLPKHYWQEIRCLGATVLLFIFIGMRSSLPIFARAYNNLGLLDYRAGDFSSAEANYQRAIALYPNLPQAHYNLGLLYEDLQDYGQARSEYALATQGGQIEAYNNLARLQMLDENYLEALNLLQNPQVQHYTQDANTNSELRYTLLKNTAWALQGLGFHREAVNRLQQAIELDDQRAVAYCLLAQSLEAIESSQRALMAWQDCRSYPETLQNPEEHEWFFKAGQRIQGDLEEPQ